MEIFFGIVKKSLSYFWRGEVLVTQKIIKEKLAF